MPIDDRVARLKQFRKSGEKKGYVLFDDINELLREHYVGGGELDDLLSMLESAGVEILEEPKIESDKKLREVLIRPTRN